MKKEKVVLKKVLEILTDNQMKRVTGGYMMCWDDTYEYRVFSSFDAADEYYSDRSFCCKSLF